MIYLSFVYAISSTVTCSSYSDESLSTMIDENGSTTIMTKSQNCNNQDTTATMDIGWINEETSSISMVNEDATISKTAIQWNVQTTQLTTHDFVQYVIEPTTLLESALNTLMSSAILQEMDSSVVEMYSSTIIETKETTSIPLEETTLFLQIIQETTQMKESTLLQPMTSTGNNQEFDSSSITPSAVSSWGLSTPMAVYTTELTTSTLEKETTLAFQIINESTDISSSAVSTTNNIQSSAPSLKSDNYSTASTESYSTKLWTLEIGTTLATSQLKEGTTLTSFTTSASTSASASLSSSTFKLKTTLKVNKPTSTEQYVVGTSEIDAMSTFDVISEIAVDFTTSTIVSAPVEPTSTLPLISSTQAVNTPPTTVLNALSTPGGIAGTVLALIFFIVLLFILFYRLCKVPKIKMKFFGEEVPQTNPRGLEEAQLRKMNISPNYVENKGFTTAAIPKVEEPSSPTTQAGAALVEGLGASTLFRTKNKTKHLGTTPETSPAPSTPISPRNKNAEEKVNVDAFLNVVRELDRKVLPIYLDYGEEKC